MDFRFYIGLDLGQSSDFTALIVNERLPDTRPALYQLRHVQRFPLRSSYPLIVQQVGEFCQRPPLAGQSALLVDETGVGRPIVDLLKDKKLPVKLYPITITAGNSVLQDGSAFHVPKRHLASAVKVVLDGARLQIDRGLPLRPVLEKELQNFKVKINTQTGHDSYEAWRESDHDDLVLAIALSLWFAERRKGRKAFEGYAAPTTTTPTGVVVTKISDTLEEITVVPPTEEELRKQREGWTWSDVVNGRRQW